TKYWKTISPRSSTLFLAGVFSLFASFGFITANMGFERPDPIAASIAAVVYGAFGMAWAFAGTRRIVWMMIALGFAQLVVNVGLQNVLARWLPEPRSDAAELRRFAMANGAGALSLVVAAYVLFILFFRREGIRYYSTFTEMRLAREIHQRTVPLIS